MEKISDERLISIRNDGEAGGTFAAADVLSMIGEIIYSRKRIAELLNAYQKLEADARVSQGSGYVKALDDVMVKLSIWESPYVDYEKITPREMIDQLKSDYLKEVESGKDK